MPAQPGRKKTVAAIVGVFLTVAVLGIYALTTGGSSSRPAQPSPGQTQTEVRISSAQIGTTANLYTYNSSGVSIYYFAVKGSDGQYHVAVDACDVCYSAKKGYRQVGDVMECNNCGRQFAINSIGTQNLTGGCWPSYLPMSIDGTNITIEISDLENKRYMFE